MYRYEVRGGPAFAEVVVTLAKGQKIVADGGALQWLRSPVLRGEWQLGGVLKAIGRALGGESLTQNVYEVDPAAPEGATGQVCFASPFPGDALCVTLREGVPWTLSRGAYLASSPNVRVSGKLNWRGLLPFGQEEGAVLPTVVAKDGPGCVFVGAYGGHQVHDLRDGETLMVDNGLFLAADGDGAQYELVKMGRTLMSSFLGGEGLGMMFRGPCRVHTQSRNFNDLVAQVAYRLPSDVGGGGVAGAVAAGAAAGAAADALDIFGGGRGKGRGVGRRAASPRPRTASSEGSGGQPRSSSQGTRGRGRGRGRGGRTIGQRRSYT